MSANRAQGLYLGVFSIAFVGLPAGLVVLLSHHVIGVIITVASVVLLARSVIGLYRIRRLEMAS